MKSGVHTDSTFSAERGGGQGQGLGGGGQGLGSGARVGGHATLPGEAPRPPRTVRFVALPEAAAVAAGQPRAPPPRQQHEEVKVEKEEQTPEQLRDQLGLTRVPAPGPRAARVLINIEDSTSGKDVNGGGKRDTLAGSVHHEDTAQGRKQRATQPYSGDERGVGVPGAGAPSSRRARLPPGTYADTAIGGESDDDYEEDDEEEEDDDDEEEGEGE